MKKIILILIPIFLSACGENNGPQYGSATNASQPSAKMTTWCGESILSIGGFAFQVNLQTGATTQLQDGTYGYSAYTNGWGTPIPACWFEITNGVPAGQSTTN